MRAFAYERPESIADAVGLLAEHGPDARLLAFDAVVVAAGPGGPRRIALDELLVRSGLTTLARDELVTAIELPQPDVARASAHLRRTRRRGHDLAAVTIACVVRADGRTRI